MDFLEHRILICHASDAKKLKGFHTVRKIKATVSLLTEECKSEPQRSAAYVLYRRHARDELHG